MHFDLIYIFVIIFNKRSLFQKVKYKLEFNKKHNE